ncbi:Chromo-like domain superfamily [Sesbania bispinosa]|nr:Chromo-like domain superfamily [Sesbania bispinosa]
MALSLLLDHSTRPPTRLVLVQWLGPSPEDVSWENWDDLCSVFHLEDKVIFPEDGNDSIAADSSNLGSPPGLESRDEVRPKRRIMKRPTYLNDYV